MAAHQTSNLGAVGSNPTYCNRIQCELNILSIFGRLNIYLSKEVQNFTLLDEPHLTSEAEDRHC